MFFYSRFRGSIYSPFYNELVSVSLQVGLLYHDRFRDSICLKKFSKSAAIICHIANDCF